MVSVLQLLYRITFYTTRTAVFFSVSFMAKFNQDFTTKVTKLVCEKFDSLPKSGKPVFGREWTTIAAIVMHSDEVGLKVVSLATGSKCIGRSKMSHKGDLINDSHAEVLARRGFLRYLYEQINLFKENGSSIFVQDEKLKIKENISFHLFMSQVPCGDASIFPTHVQNSNSEYENSITSVDIERRKQIISDINDDMVECIIEDINRTGAKCLSDSLAKDEKLPGRGYHITGVGRTKPGRGDPTLSMSCSDKILKWTFMGIQGALISILVEPIYLTSIIVSCNERYYSYHAMKRAIFNRSKKLTELYMSLNHPLPMILHCGIELKFSKYSNNTDIEARPCPCSVIWCDVNMKNHEVCVKGRWLGLTKKKSSYNPLLVTKIQFLRSFRLLSPLKYENYTYAAIKQEAIEYQNKWQCLQNVIGQWTRKDASLQAFK